LDAIAVAEFSKNGAPMNWCKYLLTELFQACVDAHDRPSYFIYGYLLITFTMWKWKPPWGCNIARNTDGCITKLFDPWNFLLSSTNEACS
jgi:hypothetical protein